MQSNIFDTALIIEGGGMRASYSAAMINTLLENQIYFDMVYGISAGSSHTVNYISRDIWRTKESFVSTANLPDFGNWKTFLSHKGLFNAHYVYQEIGRPDGPLPFDMQTFLDNPAKLCIASMQRDSGKTVYFHKEDMQDLENLMIRVRASSSLPLFMPPPNINGCFYYDGGLGEGSGLLLHKAIEDGFDKFFVIRTRPREFRKEGSFNPLIPVFWKRPYVRQALATRNERYNAVCDQLVELEKEGSAYIVYADDITATSSTDKVAILEENYQMGYAQAQRELPAWKAFLGI